MSAIYRQNTSPYTTLYVDAHRYPDAASLAEFHLLQHACHCSPGVDMTALCDEHAEVFLAAHPEIKPSDIAQASAWMAPYWRVWGEQEISDSALASVIAAWMAQERQP